MTLSNKNTSRAASKANSLADRGTGHSDGHPPHIDVLIEDTKEGQSFPPTDLREEENRHEVQLPVESQILQMLASLQKQIDQQRAETNREREKTALKRDVVASRPKLINQSNRDPLKITVH